MVSPCPLYTSTVCMCISVLGPCVCVCARVHVHAQLPVGPDAGVCTVCKSGASRVTQAWPGLCRGLSSECLQQCSPPQFWPASLTNKDLGHLDPPCITREFVNVAGSHCLWWSVVAEFKIQKAFALCFLHQSICIRWFQLFFCSAALVFFFRKSKNLVQRQQNLLHVTSLAVTESGCL